MTTIIVVVVVALVFFVAVCVVTFMVWKRESEMRTDSIRAIEENLEKLTHGLSQDAQADDHESFASRISEESDMSYMESLIAESTSVRQRKNKSHDPFGWVRETDQKVRSNEKDEAEEIYQAITEISEPGNNTEAIPPALKGGEEHHMPEEKSPGDTAAKDFEPAEAEMNETTENNEPTETIEIFDSNEIRQAPQEAQEQETEIKTENDFDEISLDFIDQIDQTDRQEEPKYEAEASKYQMGYDIGRSGRKYTASELETLIKE